MFMIATTLGDIVVPTCNGYLVDHGGTMAFMYALLAYSLGMLVCYCAIHYIGCNYVGTEPPKPSGYRQVSTEVAGAGEACPFDVGSAHGGRSTKQLTVSGAQQATPAAAAHREYGIGAALPTSMHGRRTVNTGTVSASLHGRAMVGQSMHNNNSIHNARSVHQQSLHKRRVALANMKASLALEGREQQEGGNSTSPSTAPTTTMDDVAVDLEMAATSAVATTPAASDIAL